MSQRDPVRIEITIAAPIDDVWRALREPDQIRRWHGWEYDEAGGLDGEVKSIFLDDVEVSEVERILDTGGGRFELTAIGASTVLRVVMAAPADDPSWDGYYDEIEQGWRLFAEQLRFALERHPGEDRRTIYLAGTSGDVADRDPFAIFGLEGLGSVRSGERYEARGPYGDHLAGELRLRSERELVLSVDGWGDGLLVAFRKPEGEGEAGVAAVLTTYGLESEAFERLRATAGEWWETRFGGGVAQSSRS